MVEKTEIEMENGSKVEITGSTEDIEGASFYVPNWKAGNSPHKSISQAFLKAMVEVDESVLIGTYNGKPVYDVEKTWDKVIGTAIETLGLNIEKAVATSRVGVKKQLSALQQAVIAKDPEMAKELGLI